MERKQQLGNLASSFLNNFLHAGVGNFTRRNQITPFNLQSTDLVFFNLLYCFMPGKLFIRRSENTELLRRLEWRGVAHVCSCPGKLAQRTHD